MQYKFAHKRRDDWNFEELAIIERTLALISSPLTEDPFLVVGKYLADLFKIEFPIIGRIDEHNSEKITTVCFLKHGEPLPNFTYNLAGSPCHNTCLNDVCYFPFGVRETFPNDAGLKEMNIESYMGTSLIDKNGQEIGVIALLDEDTIPNPGFIEYLITIISPVLEYHLLPDQNKPESQSLLPDFTGAGALSFQFL